MRISRRQLITRVVPAMLAALVLALAAAPAAGAAPAGQVVAAGYNYYGEFGTGEGNEYLTSLQTPSYWGPTLATQAAGSDYNNYVLLANGTVAAAGYNEYGDNGLGMTSVATYVPRVIPGLTGVSEVAAGYDYFGLALLSNGTVDGWGYGDYGELGNGKSGSTAEEDSPTPIAGLEHVTQIVAGCYYGMALRSNRTVEAWGWGAYGELGDGGTGGATTPQEVPGLTNVVAIASGCYTSYALLADGKVMAWGWGGDGQLGNATTTEKQLTPVEVTGLAGVTQISAGYYAGYALLANGTVMSWGYNKDGELGDGSTTEHNEPELIPGLTGVSKIAAASQTAYATLSNGTVDGWGYGYYGELANGKQEEAAQETSPTPIPGLSNVISIATGDYNYSLMAIEGASATLSASSLSFAGQEVGSQSAAQTITLTNGGPAPLAVSGDELSGTAAGSFLKTADTCQGQTIAAGSSCSISFAFKPSATGSQSASVTLTTSAANTLAAVTLSGTGTSATPTPVTSTTTTTTSTASAGTVRVAGSATVRGAEALVGLSCTGQGACKGSVKLIARIVHKRIVKRHGKRHVLKRTRMVVIGRASLSLAKGRSETLQVHLSAKGRSLLRKAGKRGLEVAVKGREVKTGTLVLKQARRRRKHAARAKHAMR